MGNLLGAPVTTKETHTGAMEYGKYGVSSMQGWRISMEDMHITETRVYAKERQAGGTFVKHTLDGHSIFAVFDGHGGSFAAFYAGKNFCRILSRQAKFVEYAKFIKEKDAKLKSISDADKKTEYLDAGIAMLKEGLSNAFLEIDMEIACACQGHRPPDADEPYHPDEVPAAACSEENATDAGNQMQPGDSGTTACVVMIAPDWVVCANAGDSRSVMGREGPLAVPLSFDHKPEDESEAQRIRAAGGYVTMGRVEGDLAVSRGLGDYRFKNLATVMSTPSSGFATNGVHIENQDVAIKPSEQKVSPVPEFIVVARDIQQERFIVVACDGIFDVMTNRDLIELTDGLFREGESDLGLICEELCDIALARGSKDNMTVITIQLSGQQIGTGGGVTARREKRKDSGTHQLASKY